MWRAAGGPLFSNRMLWLLLAASVATNAVVMGRTVPFDWHRFVHRDQPVPAVTAGDHTRGPATARVTIIEYSDFQCAFCARFHDVLAAAVAGASDVRWVYRHLPLAAIHPAAAAAAEAADCASEQGRFWEYADLLFRRQDRLDDGQLSALAQELRLDVPHFEACRQSGRRREGVASHAKAFAEGHLAGTPVSFVNGVRLEGAVSAAELEAAIAAARAADAGVSTPTQKEN